LKLQKVIEWLEIDEMTVGKFNIMVVTNC
jgi:hypothetical protein